jgi:hypothetical protein
VNDTVFISLAYVSRTQSTNSTEYTRGLPETLKNNQEHLTPKSVTQTPKSAENPQPNYPFSCTFPIDVSPPSSRLVGNRKCRLLVDIERQSYLLRPLPTSLSHMAESSHAYRYRQQVLGRLVACADLLRVIRFSIRLCPAVPHISNGPKAVYSGDLTL